MRAALRASSGEVVSGLRDAVAEETGSPPSDCGLTEVFGVERLE